MRIPQAALDNLHLLTAETAAQCVSLRKAAIHVDAVRLQQLLERAGHVANFKSRIQTRCIETIAANSDLQERHKIQLLETAEIAHQLERVTDKFRDFARHLLEVKHTTRFPGARFKTALARVRETLVLLQQLTLPPSESHVALGISRSADRLEKQSKKLHAEFVHKLENTTESVSDLGQGLLMANALRQMGSALQEISDCLLSIQLGQSMHTDRYKSLQAVMTSHPSVAEALVTPIADTRSGGAIAGLMRKAGDTPAAVFKEGLKRKLKKERQGVKNWHTLYPGLAPRILAHDRQGNQAALLIEHLPGVTFEQCMIGGSDEQLEAAFSSLSKTLRDVWRTTLSPQRVSAGFMSQLQKRLPDIRSTHPTLLADGARIGRLQYPNFEQIVKRAGQLEKKVLAPFSVYIHGDFNVDNILYDPEGRRIHFVDLHRSQHMDYVQDVSVFIVSCFRQPGQGESFRKRVWRVSSDMHKAARRFAQQNGDSSYDFRLALGLARSLATSTRFIADANLSRGMLARSRYLLERCLEIDISEVENFRIPLKELLHG